MELHVPQSVPDHKEDLAWVESFASTVLEEAATLAAGVAHQLQLSAPANGAKPKARIDGMPLQPCLSIGPLRMALSETDFNAPMLFDDMKWYAFESYCSAKDLAALDAQCGAALREGLSKVGYDLRFLCRYYSEGFTDMEERRQGRVFSNSLPIASIAIFPL